MALLDSDGMRGLPISPVLRMKMIPVELRPDPRRLGGVIFSICHSDRWSWTVRYSLWRPKLGDKELRGGGHTPTTRWEIQPPAGGPIDKYCYVARSHVRGINVGGLLESTFKEDERRINYFRENAFKQPFLEPPF